MVATAALHNTENGTGAEAALTISAQATGASAGAPTSLLMTPAAAANNGIFVYARGTNKAEISEIVKDM